jgi:hypothetical protein
MTFLVASGLLSGYSDVALTCRSRRMGVRRDEDGRGQSTADQINVDVEEGGEGAGASEAGSSRCASFFPACPNEILEPNLSLLDPRSVVPSDDRRAVAKNHRNVLDRGSRQQ